MRSFLLIISVIASIIIDLKKCKYRSTKNNFNVDFTSKTRIYLTDPKSLPPTNHARTSYNDHVLGVAKKQKTPKNACHLPLFHATPKEIALRKPIFHPDKSMIYACHEEHSSSRVCIPGERALYIGQ